MSSKGWGAPTLEPMDKESALSQRVATCMWLGFDDHVGTIGVAGDIFVVRAGNSITTPYTVLRDVVKEATQYHTYDRMAFEICWLNYHQKPGARMSWRGGSEFIYDQLVRNASRIMTITKARMNGIPLVLKSENGHVYQGLASQYDELGCTVYSYPLNDPQFSYHSIG
jgi:hypothetical protein